ncbi:MAG: hypothetical protein MJ076_02445 [Clostridia bacterium]|nr:hypothetical protein [Clostridia bacterium]
MIISDIKSSLPKTKIMIMEPFVLKGYKTENTEENTNRWESFAKEVPIRAKIAKKIAEKYNLLFVELQSKLDEVSTNIDTSYWLSDGVHPTPMGHELIKREWIKAFNKLLIDRGN